NSFTTNNMMSIKTANAMDSPPIFMRRYDLLPLMFLNDCFNFSNIISWVNLGLGYLKLRISQDFCWVSISLVLFVIVEAILFFLRNGS
ncbi:MAG: hypothetical protein C0597_10895, partial [Marinilabiliales bacterium]